MLVGGIADTLSCGERQGKSRAKRPAASASTYSASDYLSLPMTSSSLISSQSIPSSLTGSSLALADSAVAQTSSGNVYLGGGQTSSGALVDFSTIGVWTKANGWASQTTSGDVPSGRIGATLVAHPSLDML